MPKTNPLLVIFRFSISKFDSSVVCLRCEDLIQEVVATEFHKTSVYLLILGCVVYDVLPTIVSPSDPEVSTRFLVGHVFLQEDFLAAVAHVNPKAIGIGKDTANTAENPFTIYCPSCSQLLWLMDYCGLRHLLEGRGWRVFWQRYLLEHILVVDLRESLSKSFVVINIFAEPFFRRLSQLPI